MDNRIGPIALFIVCVLAHLVSVPRTVLAQAGAGGTFDSNAAWSPAGDKIAFVSDRAGNFDVWLVKPDGSNLENLTPDNPGYDGDVSWSPDGTQIAFVSERDARLDIWTMAADGTQLTNVTTDVFEVAGSPRWSPDGMQIAFVAVNKHYETHEIWVVGADGGDPRSVASSNGNSYIAPSWLNAQQIVFRDQNPAGRQLWKADLDDEGAISVLVCTSQLNVINPEASPMTGDIVFASVGNFDIWVTDATGETCTRLTTSGINGSPAWSPDGTMIAFQSVREDGTGIWVMARDGSHQAKVPNADGGYYASWSPTGEQIVFSSVHDGDFDIWVINQDGTHPVNLTGTGE